MATDQEIVDRAVRALGDDMGHSEAMRHLGHLMDLCDERGVLTTNLRVQDLLRATARLCERDRALRTLCDRVEDVAGQCAASWVQDKLRAALSEAAR